jgi:hypothetical protein
VTYVPYDPFFETPDEGGPGGRLIGASNPYASQPSRVQLAASNQKRGDSKEVKRTTPDTAIASRSGNNLYTATSARTKGLSR